MISIKYDFSPRPLHPSLSRERAVLFSSRASPPPPPTSPNSIPLSLSPPGLPCPSQRGGGEGNPGFNSFPYNFLPMHREKLARNTHAHAHTPRENPLFVPSSFIGGHRLLDFIEFSSSARRHPVQTRIRQLTPLAWGIRN